MIMLNIIILLIKFNVIKLILNKFKIYSVIDVHIFNNLNQIVKVVLLNSLNIIAKYVIFMMIIKTAIKIFIVTYAEYVDMVVVIISSIVLPVNVA